MDRSKSSEANPTLDIVIPKRSFNTEFFVGLFTLGGVLAGGWLAVGLGDIHILARESYEIYAEFDNISGLKNGASVEIAGVPIGQVSNISLKDPAAKITLSLDKSIALRDDDIASIRTKGIIGDRYVKISRGSSDKAIPPGGTMTETESVVDIEDIIGKIVHSLSGDKSESGDKGGSKAGS